MNVKTISMERTEANRAWREYRLAMRDHKLKYLRDTEKALSFLRRGKKILDITQVFQAPPLTDDWLPAIAIAPAWVEKVVFWQCGHHNYGRIAPSRWSVYSFQINNLPATSKPGEEYQERQCETVVPTIPPQYLPAGNLKKGKYYIFWEVEDWKAVPKDPILLKRLSKNLFAVLAVWDLTELEQAVLRGR